MLKLEAHNIAPLYYPDHDRTWLAAFDEEWPTREEAEAAIARYHAAVVESSPEVARLRADNEFFKDEFLKAKADADSAQAMRAEAGRASDFRLRSAALAIRMAESEVAALRRERDELRAALAEVLRIIPRLPTCGSMGGGSEMEARAQGRFIAKWGTAASDVFARIAAALTPNPTGGDHG